MDSFQNISLEVFWALMLILLLVILSALFSGSETAFTAASTRHYLLAKRGNRRAIILLKLRSRMDRLIAFLLLGNNFVNILASALATSLLIGAFGDAGIYYATLIMTGVILIFAEILPKTIAVKYADRLALRLSPLIRVLMFITLPILWLLQLILWLLSKPWGFDLFQNIAQDHSEESLRGAIEMQDDNDRDEKQMLHSILDLDDIPVANVMTHRKDVEIIDLSHPPAEIIDQILESPYSRFPLIDGSYEEIIGIIHIKPLMAEYHRSKGKKLTRKNIMSAASKPWFVPDSTFLDDQLKYFQNRQEHFAIVVDEYGVFLGVVTLEDILEEIVGNIDDESDDQSALATKQRDGSYRTDGTTPIRDLNRDFNWSLPDDKAATIAGLIIHEARTLPKKDQIFSFYGYRFKIIEMGKTRIISLHITPPSEPKN